MSAKVDGSGDRYVARLVDPLIERLFEELPALQLVGPRACGKTTTARRFATTKVALDDPNVAAAFRADPDAALRSLDEPVLLDEWQLVPEVLGAIKRSVDRDSRPGHAGVVAIEIKATATPKPAMARHLVWLRDRLGDRFLRGVLFHTGVAAVRLDDRVVALPISAIATG